VLFEEIVSFSGPPWLHWRHHRDYFLLQCFPGLKNRLKNASLAFQAPKQLCLKRWIYTTLILRTPPSQLRASLLSGGSQARFSLSLR
jgi:hypothetical protein